MLLRFTLEQILQDVRFAWRLMAKERAYSATAIATLALGIGANAAGFTLINATLLRGLPYESSDRLYVLSWQNRAGRRVNASYADIEIWRTARTFNELAAYRDTSINISGDGSLPEQLTGTWLTANAFGVLRQHPILGRDLAGGDERPGANPVALISHGLWQRRYGSDAKAIGTLLRINGTSATIVGVMPERMKFPDNSDVWMPLPAASSEADRNRRTLRVFGRLSDGADRAHADTEMRLLAQQAIAAAPESRDLIGVRVETFADRYVGGMGRTMFLTVMGAVVLVLLIACGNVANLLLVRMTARTREMAMRVAVGATPARIVRQLLVENLILTVIGGVIGFMLATSGVRIFGIAMQESGLPSWVVFDVDRVVFAYVAALCAVVALLFGLAPAWHVSNTGPNDVLKDGGRGSAGSVRVRRFGAVMVVMELALTTTLLVGAGLLLRSFLVLHSIDLGFRTNDLLTMRVPLPASKYETPAARVTFFERLEPQVEAIPGVEAAAVTTGVPPNDGGERLLEIDRPGAASIDPVFVGTVAITPRFFDVLGVSLLRGRNFDVHDGAPGMDAVIVNQRLAAQFFAGEDPIGRRLRFTERGAASGHPVDRWRTIVGIAPQIKHGSPQDGYDNAVVYLPYRQEAASVVSLLIRTTQPPETVIAAVRREVQGIDADQPVLSIQRLSQSLAETQWWWRTWGGVFSVFSSIALLLAAVGLYAVIAYSVTQQRQEIGVRMALGARRLAVYSMILKRALAQLVLGLSLGLAGAFALSELLWGRGMIVIPPDDRITYAAVATLLSVVALAASWLPAYRAARIDPMIALRAE